MLDLTFWMNMPSFYQADLFRALVRSGKVDLKVVFTMKIPEDRARLGWQDDTDGFPNEFLSERHPVADAIGTAIRYRGRIHITNGLWAGRVAESILVTLLLSRSKYFIYSEAPDPRDHLPPLKHKLLSVLGKPIVRNAAGLLPISHFAFEYFKLYGAIDSRLHPFGYFRSSTEVAPYRATHESKKTIDIVYVGQLVHRKGIDVLLSATEPLFAAYDKLHLQLIGSGSLQHELEAWVNARGLSTRITFEGAQTPRNIIERISKADMLALPSRWDGWGLVVNEALMAGIPVIVSDMCGAADVISDGVNGYVFRSENVGDLREKLERFLHYGKPDSSFSKAAATTGLNLQAENAAEYLIRVLQEEVVHDQRGSKYPWMLASGDRA